MLTDGENILGGTSNQYLFVIETPAILKGIST
jgi:hypothetical protein